VSPYSAGFSAASSGAGVEILPSLHFAAKIADILRPMHLHLNNLWLVIHSELGHRNA
jgi:hypothetical protein